MTSWIYIFSKFTSEALLFEALILFILCCGYTAFWVLRKRRYGSVDTAVPSGPVQSYLNELILNSEQLRLQLFGLLAASNPSSQSLYRLVGESKAPQTVPLIESSESDLTKKLALMEAQALEQAKVVEALTTEKARLEKSLSEASSHSADSPSALSSTSAAALPGPGGEDTALLRKKIEELEGKLAEYSVIEDDLANLKRLQQENNSLKATLAAKGISVPGTNDPAPAAWPTSPTPTEAPTPSTEGAELAPSPASPTAANADEPSTPSAAPSNHDKSEADLVAEFEKMLKG